MVTQRTTGNRAAKAIGTAAERILDNLLGGREKPAGVMVRDCSPWHQIKRQVLFNANKCTPFADGSFRQP